MIFLLIWRLAESKSNLSLAMIWKETNDGTLKSIICLNVVTIYRKCFNSLQTLKTATGGFVTKNNIASFLWTSPEMLANKPFGRNTDIW